MSDSNAFSTAAKNAMLDNLGTLAGFGSLHTAYPGDTGLNEVSGGSPAYARKAITWASAAGGSKALAATLPTFDVPGGGTVVGWLGIWSAVTVGTFYGSAPVSGGTVNPFTAFTDDVFTSYAHGLADTNQVFLLGTTGGGLPTGITEGTIYFVRDATTNTFKLALTSGGAAIDITASGEGFAQKIIPETFANQGQFAVSAATFDLLR